MNDVDNNRISIASQKFLDALTKNSIDEIVKAAYEIFNAPVLVCRSDNFLLSQYPLTKIGDWYFDSYLDNPFLPEEEARERMQDENHNQYDFPAHPNYRHNDKDDEHFCITGAVSNDDNRDIIFGIFISEDQKRDDDLEISELFVQALKVRCLIKDVAVDSNKGTYYKSSSLLRMLVQNEFGQKAPLSAIENIEPILKRNYTIASCFIPAYVDLRKLISDLTDFCKVRNIIMTDYDKSIVILFGNMNAINRDAVIKELEETLRTRLDPYNMFFTISDQFSDLTDIRFFYEQTRKALSYCLATGQSSLTEFKDTMPNSMFYDIAQSYQSCTYIFPSIISITKDDEAYGTDNYLTLKTWVLALFDKNQTADNLSIHRNTLNYRLGQIEEKYHINFEDNKTRLNILCSVLLYEAFNIK